MKVLDRQCAICNKPLKIIVNDDKSYTGGHFWNFGERFGEYWECDDCYNEEEEG